MSETLKSALQKNTHRTSTRRRGQRLTAKETVEKQDTFLKAFANTGNVRAACLQAGIDRSTVHHWNEHDEHFSMRYNVAKEDVNDMIRAEIMRRAIHGEERYVTSMGKVVYHNEKPLTIKEKSDTLLIFHAKARMPEYRDKQQIEHSGSVGVTHRVDLSRFSNEELATLEHMAHKATNGKN